MKLLLAILSTPISLPLVAMKLGYDMWLRRVQRIDRAISVKIRSRRAL